MAGRPRGNQARSEIVRLRMTPAGKQKMDEARGGMSVSDYLRDLVAQDVRKKGL